MLSLRLCSFGLTSAFVAAACVLTACQPSHPAARDPTAEEAAAFEAKGYTHAPSITGLTAGEAGFVTVTGDAPADSRVRFVFTDPLRGGAQAVGVTTDGQGHFRAEVPAAANGGLYDITVDDGGRLRPAEGRLFVPAGRPDKALLLRAGVSSQLLHPQGQGILAADFDAAGAFAVSGRVTPHASVTVIVNNEIRALAESDAQGDFTAATQVPKPTATAQAVDVIVQAANATFKREVSVVAVPPTSTDQVTPTPDGLRVDWKLPGGGIQSTVIF